MKTLIKTADIRIAYKVTIWLLLSNNIAGIALNPMAFLYSLVFLLGIPGAGFTTHYFISAVRKEQTMVALFHLCAIVYNILIWTMLKADIGFIIGGAIWPIINIVLSSIAFIFCSINFFINPNYNEN